MLQKERRLRPTAREVEMRLAGFSAAKPEEKSSDQASLAAPSLVRHTVGREESLAALHAELNSVRAGQGRLVCVAGEPGIGKTTLLDSFLEQLRRRTRAPSAARGELAPSVSRAQRRICRFSKCWKVSRAVTTGR